MALTGSFDRWIHSLSPTLSHSMVIDYPDDLPSDDPNYSKRGTQETIWVSSSISSSTNYPSAYIIIDKIDYDYSIYGESGSLIDKPRMAHYRWSLYETYQDRLDNNRHSTSSGLYTIQHHDASGSVFSASYANLKLYNGFENMTDI